MGTSPLEIQKRRQRVTGGTNPAQIPMKPQAVGSASRHLSAPRILKRQGHGLNSSKDALHSGVVKKGARRGNYHIEILLSPYGAGKKDLEGLL